MSHSQTMAHMFHKTGVQAQSAASGDGCDLTPKVESQVSGREGESQGVTEYPDDETMANTDDGTESHDEGSDGSSLGSMDEDHMNFSAKSEHARIAMEIPKAGPAMSGHEFGGNGPAFIEGLKLSFIKLQRQRHKILRGPSNYAPICFSSQQASPDAKVTALVAKIQELEETKKQIELEIEACEHGIEVARKQRIDQQVKFLLEHNGVSPELMAEYYAFLASIEPDGGQRGGFSITCFGDHENSYVEYDPSLAILKENAEDDYSVCHYRCEALKVDGPWVVGESGIPEPTRESIVEFWPVDAPVPCARGVRTWGE
ncbi:hypothetical protein BDZ45DRAFT_279158 [Acephala macrosclerotiorum]|nr:hypothetical protein BDZ45DRAFT_279158 [Acephala macrosclerotiorum]